jgi:hypothetical protein
LASPIHLFLEHFFLVQQVLQDLLLFVPDPALDQPLLQGAFSPFIDNGI